ncbi:WxcM-like domain-containing protein [Candidatus Gottesmanbacteria bacterium]|nr:WxcM-like domain-containing protein [Candidatus Gottesmanbacteria bacterium]
MKIDTYPLKVRRDERGWLVQNEYPFLSRAMKHFFVSYSKKGVVRGQHFHTKKQEWFLIIKGKAKISFEDLKTHEREEVVVSGDKPTMVAVPAGVAHKLENIGQGEMFLLAFVNEPLDQAKPDTFASAI